MFVIGLLIGLGVAGLAVLVVAQKAISDLETVGMDLRKVIRERDEAAARVATLESNATTESDALARANSRTEAAETARMAALTRADAAEAELSRIRACVNGVKPCVPSR